MHAAEQKHDQPQFDKSNTMSDTMNEMTMTDGFPPTQISVPSERAQATESAQTNVVTTLRTSPLRRKKSNSVASPRIFQLGTYEKKRATSVHNFDSLQDDLLSTSSSPRFDEHNDFSCSNSFFGDNSIGMDDDFGLALDPEHMTLPLSEEQHGIEVEHTTTKDDTLFPLPDANNCGQFPSQQLRWNDASMDCRNHISPHDSTSIITPNEARTNVEVATDSQRSLLLKDVSNEKLPPASHGPTSLLLKVSLEQGDDEVEMDTEGTMVSITTGTRPPPPSTAPKADSFSHVAQGLFSHEAWSGWSGGNERATLSLPSAISPQAISPHMQTAPRIIFCYLEHQIPLPECLRPVVRLLLEMEASVPHPSIVQDACKIVVDALLLRQSKRNLHDLSGKIFSDLATKLGTSVDLNSLFQTSAQPQALGPSNDPRLDVETYFRQCGETSNQNQQHPVDEQPQSQLYTDSSVHYHGKNFHSQSALAIQQPKHPFVPNPLQLAVAYGAHHAGRLMANGDTSHHNQNGRTAPGFTTSSLMDFVDGACSDMEDMTDVDKALLWQTALASWPGPRFEA